MKILLIENNAADARLLAEMLRQVPIDPLKLVHEVKVSKALARLRAEHYDVILFDLTLPAGQALDDVERICSAAALAAVVVLCGRDDETVAVHAMRRGAQDYVYKGSMNAPQMARVLRYAVERKLAEAALILSREELSALTRRLQVAQEEERTRIARKVHDELGQSLTALKLDLAWIERRLAAARQPEVRKKIGEMTRLVDNTIGEVRQIAADLRPGLLDHFGLPAAIEWLFKDFTQRTGVGCKLIVTPDDLGIHRDSATLLFRVVQEAMTNVARHAKATKLEISLSQNDGHLKMDIQDDGRGISIAAVGNMKSLGLLGVRERVKSVFGVMKISGVPGRGTLLTVDIPYLSGDA